MSEQPPITRKPLSIRPQREAIEQALATDDLVRAQSIATDMAERRALGPWEKSVLGRVALAAGKFADADAWLTKAHETLPDEGAILVDLALAKAGLRRWGLAAKLLGQAIAQRPNIPDLHERQAVYLANAGKTEASVEALERALALDTARASSWSLLGERRIERGEHDLAEQAFLTALTHDSANSTALWNLALVREKSGDLVSALDLLDRVPPEAAETASARHRRGQILLSLGRMEEGWREYAARLKNREYVSWQYALRVPYWAGEDLSDKHLVVWADQGLGEQLLTASLLNDAAARSGTLTFACDPRLVPLLARSLPGIQVVPLTAIKDRGPTLGQIDAQATLSELGAILRPNLAAFPEAKAFVTPNPDQRIALREKLRVGDQTVIGISWRSENALAGRDKSTTLSEHWSTVLRMPHVHFVSLQYGDISAEVAAARAASGTEITIVDEIDPTRDIDGYAALVAAMDIVISTSNTAVHMAGGLGIPTWAVLPKAYGRPWYWFDHGEVSPWYRNLTLVRSKGDWAHALSEAADQAAAYLGAKA